MIGQRWIAGSVGPYGAALADGSEYRGDYGVSVAELREWHRPRIALLAEAGADLLALETIPCLAEVEALLAEVAGTGVPCWLSLTCAGEQTRAGEPASEAFAMVARRRAEVVAVGVNCLDPADALGLVRSGDRAQRPTGGGVSEQRRAVGCRRSGLDRIGQLRRRGCPGLGGCGGPPDRRLLPGRTVRDRRHQLDHRRAARHESDVGGRSAADRRRARCSGRRRRTSATAGRCWSCCTATGWTSGWVSTCTIGCPTNWCWPRFADRSAPEGAMAGFRWTPRSPWTRSTPSPTR